jgi:hypothetical protein
VADFFQFEAFNPRGNFIRHRNFLADLTPKDKIADDFSFSLVRRGDQGLVSLRSKNFPTRFLRHRDFRLRLEEPAGTSDQLFARDSSFFMEAGMADQNGVTFRSFNFRDHVIAHRNFQLFIVPASADIAQQATFLRSRAPVLFDEGTALNPVSD